MNEASPAVARECEDNSLARDAYLLLLPQGEKADTRDLDDLEADTGNITLGLATATETGDQDLVVLIDEVQATVILPPHVNICQ